MEETLIELKNIYKIYEMGDEEVRANDGISLTINRGEFVAIVGKSGSGKSTLMNIIGALDVPSSGEYLLGGKDVGSMTDNQLACGPGGKMEEPPEPAFRRAAAEGVHRQGSGGRPVPDPGR